LAEEIGLEVQDGILVGEDLQTRIPDIYAAGDVARYPSYHGRRRVEHEDAAKSMGRVAGLNMAGRPTPYEHMPMFYSDLFDLGYEAVGDLRSDYEMVEDWQETPYKKGVVYYLDQGDLKGVLLWNVWEKVEAARELIKRPGAKLGKELLGAL
jgi:NADPH-dependent 2,4-dienoyl-CoA reductase/sulfur reductase-like enzyme